MHPGAVQYTPRPRPPGESAGNLNPARETPASAQCQKVLTTEGGAVQYIAATTGPRARAPAGRVARPAVPPRASSS